MNFNIKSELRQTLIAGQGHSYRFLTKLFTHSALLVDTDGFALAELKRNSWWKMSFVLKTNEGEYSVLEKSGDYEIIHNQSGKKFYSIGSIEFFYGRKIVSKLKVIKFEREFELMINETEHWQAILVLTCLATSRISN